MAQSGRLLSLDVMRGITIAGMILVNNPGTWEYVILFVILNWIPGYWLYKKHVYIKL